MNKLKFYSDVTGKLYNSIEECEAAEKAILKEQEERKNGQKVALAELDELLEFFEMAHKEQESANQKFMKAGESLRNKYIAYLRKYGSLPEKHYSNYILTRML